MRRSLREGAGQPAARPSPAKRHTIQERKSQRLSQVVQASRKGDSRGRLDRSRQKVDPGKYQNEPSMRPGAKKIQQLPAPGVPVQKKTPKTNAEAQRPPADDPLVRTKQIDLAQPRRFRPPAGRSRCASDPSGSQVHALSRGNKSHKSVPSPAAEQRVEIRRSKQGPARASK